MAIQVQYRRGSTSENNAFTGALAEITVDTTNSTLRVHNGATAGGFALVGTVAVQTLTNKTLTDPVISGNILNGGANATGNIGNSSGYFNTAFVKATSAQYADLAEMYVADNSYQPGTVVEFGGPEEITVTRTSHSTRVAGIVSTNPSYLMNATQTGNNVVAVALTGRVPCRVVGNIIKGDRLVSGEPAGVATVLDKNKYEPGCIIGKALEDYNSQEIGTIEVAVGRF